MNRARELIRCELLRAEKNLFTFRLFLTVASYAGITIWLNAIRQTAATWLLWALIGVQLFLFLTIFVVSSPAPSTMQEPKLVALDSTYLESNQ